MTKLVIVGAVVAAALLILMRSEQGGADDGDTAYEEPGLLDQADALFQEFTDMNSSVSPEQQGRNLAAFMKMIRVSEGTAGPDGYRTIVGGSLFDDYSDHPRQKIWIPSINDYSSAAGAFQIIRRTWDGVQGKLGLPDFSPASQDQACVELIRQRGGLRLAMNGEFAAAVEKCRKEWASLPGAGYGQRENSLAKLQTAYLNAGGQLA
ncbi:glycoside hydrolase family 24 protein [Janthinobacterium kumbetense]|uniref:Glycoside hydrolase family 104 protein n=1 Tax=Janthinobacterium kumbetense TaxID=2950280 RepID=A0ABT0WL98_9BURK|nr:glycoside hydrolase family 104 protein [Janthinobacterium kumbetense]MCM2564825.1 glycoside hydrolase family 104 protein [Janthinobacterium kumbetense]